MSSAERLVRLHKRQTDDAISDAFARLSTDPPARDSFDELLAHVRLRAPALLSAHVVEGVHPGVEALVQLARCKRAHIRGVASWVGCGRSWRVALHSLALHLVAKFQLPTFLSAAWYATDAHGDRKREWFIAHARGARFRALDLPIAMTRRMEHVFLASPVHLTIEHAMRRAELLGLGGSEPLARAVLQTRAGLDLSNGEFWRTVWEFLVVNDKKIDPAQVAPLLDFIYSIRQERITIDTPEGVMFRDPPQPSFSMSGRTAQSMLRRMCEWHRSLGLAHGGLKWSPSPMRPMTVAEPSEDQSAPARLWQMIELTNGEQLRIESAALKHCVGSYANACWRGASRIWSLRTQRGEKVRHVLTIEVDVRRRLVVQARGLWNRRAEGKPLKLLQQWASRERLRLAM